MMLRALVDEFEGCPHPGGLFGEFAVHRKERSQYGKRSARVDEAAGPDLA